MYGFAASINTLILQTFVNRVINNKLGKDDKDMRINSKCNAFIWRIDKKEMVVCSWTKVQS